MSAEQLAHFEQHHRNLRGALNVRSYLTARSVSDPVKAIAHYWAWYKLSGLICHYQNEPLLTTDNWSEWI